MTGRQAGEEQNWGGEDHGLHGTHDCDMNVQLTSTGMQATLGTEVSTVSHRQ